MLKKLRDKRKDKKGFTLVELIVVLIILAILAALLIPALTGYIDKAKNKQVVAETRQAVMATQTLADEDYAVDVTPQFGKGRVISKNIKSLAEVDGKISGVTFDSSHAVATLTYESKSGKTCTYTAGGTKGTDGAYDVK
ncbi:prepilin-type N-terminal cleavage/methylation domain-containing protein [Roseburia hominis]